VIVQQMPDLFAAKLAKVAPNSSRIGTSNNAEG
jgi:hypothetical protein